MVGPEEKAKFIAFLRTKRIAVLSTVTPSHQPSSGIIYFYVEDDLTFYFMAKKGRKTDNIKTNNQVALVVGTEEIPVTAQIEGTAEKIEDPGEYEKRKQQLLDIISQNKFMPPIIRLAGVEVNIYKITPTRITWLDQRNSDENINFIQIV